MKDRLLTIVISLLLFACGYLTGIWRQCTKPVPAPPVDLLGEIGGVARYSPSLRRLLLSAEGRDALAGELEHLKPEYDAFMAKMEAIEANFQKDLKALLTDEQKVKFSMLKKWSKTPATAPAPTEVLATTTTAPANVTIAAATAAVVADGAVTPPAVPGITTKPRNGFFEPFDAIASLVIIRNTYEHLNEGLQFTPAQQSQVYALLEKRRAAFLALADQSPPPSLKLSQFVVAVREMAAKRQAANDSAKP